MSQAPPIVSPQRAARIIGVLFLLTFVTSIGAYALYGSVLDDTGWVLGDSSDTAIRVGALLEVLLVAANIGTAIVLTPSCAGTCRRSRSGGSPRASSSRRSSRSGS